ncbi:MAG: Rieske 2Fe-2S domain-containing protein [Rhodocyclaceae bacterium]|nr:Rieske 2Fe-2S domain-containing protein [Rhodocyclaceae bacterium]
MAGDARLICTSGELAEGGAGVRFELQRYGRAMQAFVVRYCGVARAYLNECAHVPIELDWMPGQFFDDSGLYLICATHGAIYDPASGRCLGGPCNGRGLLPVQVEERDGGIYLIEQTPRAEHDRT